MSDSIPYKRPWWFRLALPPGRLLRDLACFVFRKCSSSDTYFDTARFPWVPEVEAYYPEIRREIQEALNAGKVHSIEEVVPRSYDILEQESQWKVTLLRYYGIDVEGVDKRFPITHEALSKIPGLMTAAFSALQPGASVPPHRGSFPGVLKVHLALIIPSRELCGITVEHETRSWDEGKIIIFDDTYLHEAWNNSDKIRVVLLCDIIRPLPLPLHLFVKLVISILAKLPAGSEYRDRAAALANR